MTESSADLCGQRVIHSEKVAKARSTGLSALEIEGVCGIFKACGDPSRLKILHALASQEMCVCDLAALLDISESAVSHQLRLLRTMQLVANRREGNILHYRLADAHVPALINLALEHQRELVSGQVLDN